MTDVDLNFFNILVSIDPEIGGLQASFGPPVQPPWYVVWREWRPAVPLKLIRNKEIFCGKSHTIISGDSLLFY